MSALRILFVIDGLWVGGTERSLAEMLPYLIKADIQPIIACLRRRGDEGVETEVLGQGFDVRFLNGIGIVSKVQDLRRLIKTEKPDLVHSALFTSNILSRLAGIRVPVPVMSSLVSTPYETVRLKEPGINIRKLRTAQMIDAWSSRHLTDHFHAVSRAAKTAAVETQGIPPQKITVIHRGRDPVRLGHPSAKCRRKARLKLGLTADDQVIVNVGRHEYPKGQEYLLKAMSKLLPLSPKVVLLIAGRRGKVSLQLDVLRKQLGLNGRAHFLGHRDDVPEILAAADLSVFPSLYEGFPGAVIEAMALGLPVVASDIAPVREVVEEDCNAILVEPASSRPLAKAIELLLEDKAKADAFGKRSREIFEERFTIERNVSRMIKLYRRVAAMRSRNGV